MFGTDWPVCLLKINEYREWAETVRNLASSLSTHEQLKILLRNGEEAYQLPSQID